MATVQGSRVTLRVTEQPSTTEGFFSTLYKGERLQIHRLEGLERGAKVE